MGEIRFRIHVSSKAELEIGDAALWWADNRDEGQAKKWLERVDDALIELAGIADHCPTARESKLFPFLLREYNFGVGRRPSHRLLFDIVGDTVNVLSVRHLAQRDVTMDDI